MVEEVETCVDVEEAVADWARIPAASASAFSCLLLLLPSSFSSFFSFSFFLLFLMWLLLIFRPRSHSSWIDVCMYVCMYL